MYGILIWFKNQQVGWVKTFNGLYYYFHGDSSESIYRMRVEIEVDAYTKQRETCVEDT
jgi:hypothetical protein